MNFCFPSSSEQSSKRTECEEILRHRDTPFCESEESSRTSTPCLQSSQVLLNAYTDSRVGYRPITPSKAYYQRPYTVCGGPPFLTSSVDRYYSPLNTKRTTAPRFCDDYYFKYASTYSSDRNGALFTNRVNDYSSARSHVNNFNDCNPDTYSFAKSNYFNQHNTGNSCCDDTNTNTRRYGTYFGYNYEYDARHNRSNYHTGTHPYRAVGSGNQPQQPINCDETYTTTSGIPKNVSPITENQNYNKDSQGNNKSNHSEVKPSPIPAKTVPSETRPKHDGDTHDTQKVKEPSNKNIKGESEPQQPINHNATNKTTPSSIPGNEAKTHTNKNDTKNPTKNQHDVTPSTLPAKVVPIEARPNHEGDTNESPEKKTNSNKAVIRESPPQQPIRNVTNATPSAVHGNIDKTHSNQNVKQSPVPKNVVPLETKPKYDGDTNDTPENQRLNSNNSAKITKGESPPQLPIRNVTNSTPSAVPGNIENTHSNENVKQSPVPINVVPLETKPKQKDDTNDTPENQHLKERNSNKTIKGESEPKQPTNHTVTNTISPTIPVNETKTHNLNNTKDPVEIQHDVKTSSVPLKAVPSETRPNLEGGTHVTPENQNRIVTNSNKTVPGESPPQQPIKNGVTTATPSAIPGNVKKDTTNQNVEPSPVSARATPSETRPKHEGDSNATPENQHLKERNSNKIVKGESEPKQPTNQTVTNTISPTIPANEEKPHNQNNTKDPVEIQHDVKTSSVPEKAVPSETRPNYEGDTNVTPRNQNLVVTNPNKIVPGESPPQQPIKNGATNSTPSAIPGNIKNATTNPNVEPSPVSTRATPSETRPKHEGDSNDTPEDPRPKETKTKGENETKQPTKHDVTIQVPSTIPIPGEVAKTHTNQNATIDPPETQNDVKRIDSVVIVVEIPPKPEPSYNDTNKGTTTTSKDLPNKEPATQFSPVNNEPKGKPTLGSPANQSRIPHPVLTPVVDVVPSNVKPQKHDNGTSTNPPVNEKVNTPSSEAGKLITPKATPRTGIPQPVTNLNEEKEKHEKQTPESNKTIKGESGEPKQPITQNKTNSANPSTLTENVAKTHTKQNDTKDDEKQIDSVILRVERAPKTEPSNNGGINIQTPANKDLPSNEIKPPNSPVNDKPPTLEIPSNQSKVPPDSLTQKVKGAPLNVHWEQDASRSPKPTPSTVKSPQKHDKGTSTDSPIKQKANTSSSETKQLITPEMTPTTNIPQATTRSKEKEKHTSKVPESNNTNKPKNDNNQNIHTDFGAVRNGKSQPDQHPQPGTSNTKVPKNITTALNKSDRTKPTSSGKPKHNSTNNGPLNRPKQVNDAMVVQNYMKLLGKGTKPNLTRIDHLKIKNPENNKEKRRENQLPKHLQKRAAEFFPPALLKRINATPSTSKPLKSHKHTDAPSRSVENQAVQKNKKSKSKSVTPDTYRYNPPRGSEPYYAPAFTNESKKPSILSPSSQNERKIPYHDPKYIPINHRKVPYVHNHNKKGHPLSGVEFHPYRTEEGGTSSEDIREGALALAYEDNDEVLVTWEPDTITHTVETVLTSNENHVSFTNVVGSKKTSKPKENHCNVKNVVGCKKTFKPSKEDHPSTKVKIPKKTFKPQLSVPSHIIPPSTRTQGSITAGLPDLSNLIRPKSPGITTLRTEFDKYLQQYEQSLKSVHNLAALTTTFKPTYRPRHNPNLSTGPNKNSLQTHSNNDPYCNLLHEPGCFSESDLSSERRDACSVSSNTSYNMPRINRNMSLYSVESDFSNISAIGEAIDSVINDMERKSSNDSSFYSKTVSITDFDEPEKLLVEGRYDICLEKEAIEQIIEDINGNTTNLNDQYQDFQEHWKKLRETYSKELNCPDDIIADIEPAIDYINSLHDLVSEVHLSCNKHLNDSNIQLELPDSLLLPKIRMENFNLLNSNTMIDLSRDNSEWEEKYMEILNIDLELKSEDFPEIQEGNQDKVNKIAVDTLERSCLIGLSKVSARDSESANIKFGRLQSLQESALDKYIDAVLHRSMNYKEESDNEDQAGGSSGTDMISDVDSDTDLNDLTDKDSDIELELPDQESTERPTSFTDSAFRFIVGVTSQCSQFLLPLASQFLNLEGIGAFSPSSQNHSTSNSRINESRNVSNNGILETSSDSADENETTDHNQKPLVSVLKKSSVYIGEDVHKITHGRSVHFGSPITSAIKILEPETDESTTSLYFERKSHFPVNYTQSHSELSDENPISFITNYSTNNPFITMTLPTRNTSNSNTSTSVKRTTLDWSFV